MIQVDDIRFKTRLEPIVGTSLFLEVKVPADEPLFKVHKDAEKSEVKKGPKTLEKSKESDSSDVELVDFLPLFGKK